METTKTKIREAIKMLNFALNEIEKPGLQAKISFDQNPFKCLRKTTVSIYQDLKLNFGYDWVDRKNPKIKLIEQKYFIKDFADVLKSLNKKGLCDIEFNNNSNSHGSQRITRFRIK